MKHWVSFVKDLVAFALKRLTCQHDWVGEIRGELGVVYVSMTCRHCKAVRFKQNGL